MTWRDKVLEAARGWLGTPYHHAARVKGAGVDCAMLLTAVYHEAGLIPEIDPRPYPQDWHLHRGEERFLNWVRQYGRQLSDGELPSPGDIVLFRYGRCVSHGGIVLNWPTIIHAYMPLGKVTMDDVLPGSELAVRHHSTWTFDT
jgi:cell wall-associated NlpC family hydrolase